MKICRVCGSTGPMAKRGAKCKACDASRAKQNYKDNRDARVAVKRVYNDENRDKVNASKRKSYLKNRAAYRRREMARKRGYVLIHTRKEWLDLKRKHGFRCLACGSHKDITRDHVKPIKLGGTDHIDNIQPLCRSCNSSKGAKEIDYRA